MSSTGRGGSLNIAQVDRSIGSSTGEFPLQGPCLHKNRHVLLARMLRSHAALEKHQFSYSLGETEHHLGNASLSRSIAWRPVIVEWDAAA